MRAFWLLLASVLVAVGIGIGVEAAVLPTLYGPSGASFSAAFPAAPTKHMRVLLNAPAADIVAGPVYSYVGGTKREQLTVTVTVLRFNNGQTRLPRQLTLERLAPAPLRLENIGGRQGATAVRCGEKGAGRRSCVAVLLYVAVPVGSTSAIWTASAVAPSASRARALVESLVPSEPVA